MKLTMETLLKSTLPALFFLCGSTMSHAASVDIIGYQEAEIQKTVVGVWSSNNKVTFSSSGKYSILLSDYGISSAKTPAFGSNFNYLGAMVSSSTNGNIASATFDKNSKDQNIFLTFDVTAGDYWLSLFAITDSYTNVGTFNMSLMEGDVNPVPLPASFWLMTTSLLGLFCFLRQKKVADKLKVNSENMNFA